MKWDKIEIGARAIVVKKITRSDMATFSLLTRDNNPVHDTGVVYGMLTTAFVSTLVGVKLPGHGAIIATQSFEYLKPVMVGDTIYVVGTVTRKSEATHGVILDIKITNQKNEAVVVGMVTAVAHE